MKRVFEEHGALVMGTVPAERLLVFEVGEGWGPLCGFLGREGPGGGFPHVNDGGEYVRGFRRARNWVVGRVLVRGVLLVGPVVAAAVWVWWGRG